jgi:hypothetical protein
MYDPACRKWGGIKYKFKTMEGKGKLKRDLGAE